MIKPSETFDFHRGGKSMFQDEFSLNFGFQLGNHSDSSRSYVEILSKCNVS